MKAEQIEMAWYYRDVKLLRGFLERIQASAPRARIVYLEGNHEERFRRIMLKYPGPFPPGVFNLVRDASPKGMKIHWIPYGNYESYFRLGDTVFTHGTIFPDAHSKQYATNYAPFKVVYGHLHDYQTWTIRTAFATAQAHYAMTAGCLTHRAPDYKKGAPNKWSNGFVSFYFDGAICTPTAHVIEAGRFSVGPKVYGCPLDAVPLVGG